MFQGNTAWKITARRTQQPWTQPQTPPARLSFSLGPGSCLGPESQNASAPGSPQTGSLLLQSPGPGRHGFTIPSRWAELRLSSRARHPQSLPSPTPCSQTCFLTRPSSAPKHPSFVSRLWNTTQHTLFPILLPVLNFPPKKGQPVYNSK